MFDKKKSAKKSAAEDYAPVPAKPSASSAPKRPLDCPEDGCDKAINHAGPHGTV